jgi:hypothetical protein
VLGELLHTREAIANQPAEDPLMNLDDAFGKILGRQPSEQERQRLYRVRDTLGLRDNDAFWYIVLILEHYDALYRDYPKQIGEHARSTLEAAREAFAAAAAAESAKAQNLLSQKVAETSVVIARKLAERPIGIHRITMLLAVVVCFGALCITAGVKLANPGRRFWCNPRVTQEGAWTILAAVLSVPAGWMVFALLLPAAVYGARGAWNLAREAETSGPRILGWTLLGLCVIATAACAAALARMLG